MRSVASFIQGIILLAIIGGCTYVVATHMNTVRQIIHNTIWAVAPCSMPVSYSLGEFDDQFGLSRTQFLDDLDQAAQIWDKAAGKNVFAYSTDGELTVNLIFDGRQKATITQNAINSVIQSDQTKYDTLKAQYDALVAEFNSKKNFVTRENEPDLEKLVNTINADATTLNALAKKLNMNVATYNTVGASNGAEFDEGEYLSDADGTRIDIYQYQNKTKLVRVLAHELGHALGLDHVDDPKAIMYYLNAGTNDTPTAADIAELTAVCKLK